MGAVTRNGGQLRPKHEEWLTAFLFPRHRLATTFAARPPAFTSWITPGATRQDCLIALLGFAGPGSDYLQGDAGDDFFVFDGSFQTSLIIDFEPGTASHHDVIQFTGGLFADFADLMAHSLQSATNTVITDAGGHALTLADVVKANLISDDFVFV